MSADLGNSSNETESAFFSPKNVQHKKYKTTKNVDPRPVKQVKCFKCKKFGHYKSQCQKLKDKTINAFSAVFFNGTFDRQEWYIDSGASTHMMNNKEKIINSSNMLSMKEIIVANQTSMPVLCAGDTHITTVVGKSEYDIIVKDVLCVPDLTTNLLSVSQLMKSGNKRNISIKTFRSDNGTEFCSKEMEIFLKQSGIVHQRTNPYSPEQNRMCERFNRTIVEKARCLLFDAKLDKNFWAEAVHTAVYLKNRSLATGLPQRTPYEVWMGRKSDVSHIRLFGSKVMVHIPKIKRTKWDKKAGKYILVGYSENIKGYRLYNPETKKVITSRDVTVMEDFTGSEITQVLVQEKDVSIEQDELFGRGTVFSKPTIRHNLCTR
ncbi:hypothetical protein K1T71_014734 [Dendrolimus kikuchii]|nr:hypothetical protein K1T71_014734 [Dendrolimus kikuchii]